MPYPYTSYDYRQKLQGAGVDPQDKVMTEVTLEEKAYLESLRSRNRLAAETAYAIPTTSLELLRMIHFMINHCQIKNPTTNFLKSFESLMTNEPEVPPKTRRTKKTAKKAAASRKKKTPRKAATKKNRRDAKGEKRSVPRDANRAHGPQLRAVPFLAACKDCKDEGQADSATTANSVGYSIAFIALPMVARIQGNVAAGRFRAPRSSRRRFPCHRR